MKCDIKECLSEARARLGHIYLCKRHLRLQGILIPELEEEIEK